MFCQMSKMPSRVGGAKAQGRKPLYPRAEVPGIYGLPYKQDILSTKSVDGLF